MQVIFFSILNINFLQITVFLDRFSRLVAEFSFFFAGAVSLFCFDVVINFVFISELALR